MPPIAKPVRARTASASGRFSFSPRCAATPFSLTRLAPDTSSRYGFFLLVPSNNRDITLCPTAPPRLPLRYVWSQPSRAPRRRGQALWRRLEPSWHSREDRSSGQSLLLQFGD